MIEQMEPLAICEGCRFLFPVRKLRPFGIDKAYICIACAFKDDEAIERTRSAVRETIEEMMVVIASTESDFAVAIPLEDLLEMVFNNEEEDEDD